MHELLYFFYLKIYIKKSPFINVEKTITLNIILIFFSFLIQEP